MDRARARFDEGRGRDDSRRSSRDDRDDDRDGRMNMRYGTGEADGRSGRNRQRDDEPRRGRDDDRPETRERDTSRAARSTFTYRERTAEALESRSRMGSTDFDKIVKDGVKSWTPHDGPNTIRILPQTWDGEPNHFGVDVYVHYGVGPDRQSYLCPQRMQDKPCPICEERAAALKDGDETWAKELAPRRRVLVYVVDRDAEREGVQVWAMPQSVDQDLATLGRDKRTGRVLKIDHPDDGFDVEFEKEGKKLNTKYKGLAIARDPSPLGKDAWLQQAVDEPLPTLLDFHDYEYIAKVFGAGGDPRGRSEDDRSERDRDRKDDDRGRGRDERGGRDREPLQTADPTWGQVHAMAGDELDKLAERECPKIDPSQFKSDEELADAICEDMGIPRERNRDDGRRRLADLRGDR